MMFDVRTTLSLDNDVLEAARELAAIQRRSMGEVISELARRSLAAPAARGRTRNGLPLLPRRTGGARVTTELVRRLDVP